jgi:bifunctional non-homologous end joining protein LigD
LHDQPPAGPGWVHEIKWDGYRAQAHLRESGVVVYSRGGLDWTDRFDTIGVAVGALPARSCIIDGEAVVLGASGKPDFQALRHELGRRSARVRYHALDLLELDGQDLRPRTLLERKRRLEKLLKGADPVLVYVEHLEGDGGRVVKQACALGLEGIVSKQADSPYRSGRQEIWIKSKCRLTETVPVIGFVEKLGARPRRIAALYTGRVEDGRLLYGGKVGTGWNDTIAEEVREALDPLIRKTSPLDVKVSKPKATWVEPTMLAEVTYATRTDEGLLRGSSFKGLREDLEATPAAAPAAAAKRSRPRAAAVRSSEAREPARFPLRTSSLHVSRSNILQLLPDAVVPPRPQLASYWRKVARPALQHLARRPLKLVRSVHGTTFYHKGKLPPLPDAVHTLTLTKREGGEGVRVWIEDLAGLLGLVEIGVVELHPWNSTVDDIEQADRLVFDLDPGDGVEWPFVVDTALALRRLLEGEDLQTWPKVTGGKGLHVMVPLPEPMPHDKARRWSRALAERIVATNRARYTVSASLAERPGRLFIDYLRNGRGTTAVGAWSPRARPGFPIARPVTWKQVEQGIDPAAFTMASPLRANRRRR